MHRIEVIESKLKDAISNVRLNGWTIGSGITISPDDQVCCPIGAACIAIGGPENDNLLIAKIGSQLVMSDDETRSFAGGFDGGEEDAAASLDFFRLGEKFRREYL